MTKHKICKFVLLRINEIEGRLAFFKLEINGRCAFDDFILECRHSGGLESELIKIQAIMQQVSDLKTLPIEKYKDITPTNDLIKEYEIKTRHLRIHMFHERLSGRVIVLGGKKTSQKKDIVQFRAIKKNFLNH